MAATALPRLRLVYFPVRAKAEPVRMALAYGNIPFEDVSVAKYFGKGWRDGAKDEAPFGQLPILEVDGEVLAQSGSIMRYVGQLAGLAPPDSFQAAKCDAIFEAAQELMTAPTAVNPIVNVFVGEEWAQKRATYFEAFPKKLTNLARQLGEGPFFFGAKPLYCDLAVYHALSNTRVLEPAALDGHPNVLALMRAVESLPGVSGYLESRPEPVEIGTAPRLQPRA